MRACSPAGALATTSGGVPRMARTDVRRAILSAARKTKSERSAVSNRNAAPGGMRAGGASPGRGA